jgi:hypothetical protein
MCVRRRIVPTVARVKRLALALGSCANGQMPAGRFHHGLSLIIYVTLREWSKKSTTDEGGSAYGCDDCRNESQRNRV